MILVIGDIMLDIYRKGKINRNSPEAPVPICKMELEKKFKLGGAANVAVATQNLGIETFLIGHIGLDPAGDKIRDLLHQVGVAYKSPHLSDRPSTMKERIFASERQILRIDTEDCDPIEFYDIDPCINVLCKTPSVVVLSDYNKGVLGSISKIITALHPLCEKIIIDPKQDELSVYSGSYLITPNKDEAERLFCCAIEEQNYGSISKLLRQNNIQFALITLASEGMILFNQTSVIMHLLSEANEVIDVTGAGDAVVSTIAFALHEGLSLYEACFLANKAAAISVGYMGVYGPRLDEILNHKNDYAEKKILTFDNTFALDLDPNLDICITNGCFDLVHEGHRSFLRKLYQKNNILCVALNSDSSIKKLKGVERPIINERFRATQVALMVEIDFVVIFNEDTPLEIVNFIKPKVLYKGSDYKREDVVGYDTLKEWGGHVQIVNSESTVRTSDFL